MRGSDSFVCVKAQSILIAGAFLLVVLTPAMTQAATSTWKSTTSTSWSTTGNWTGGTPTSSSTAVINLGTSGPIVTSADVNATASLIEIGTTAAGGTLGVQNGGVLHDATGYLGYNANSIGTATVNGSGSSWINSGIFYAGNSGTGTLNIQNGGTVSAFGIRIGNNAGSTGTITVDGTGSNLTNESTTSSFIVGYSGTGTLNIQNNGSVTDGNYFYLGYTSGSSGTLNISSDGMLTDTVGSLGNSANSIGTATVSGRGSSWTNSSSLYVGVTGMGTLNILNGGGVSNVNGFIGQNTGSSGTVIVSGTNSNWINSGYLWVGTKNGMLTIQNGGSVSDTTGYIAVASGGSTGSVTVAGTGSVWTSSQYAIVGDGGIGTLSIFNGGIVNSRGVTGTGYPGLELVGGVIGNYGGAAGTVLVDGAASAWNEAGVLLVGGGNNGNVGSGILTIQNGGTVNDVSAYVGHNSGSMGTTTITGTGSGLINTGDLYIGENGGGGTLTIVNGGTVSTGNGISYNNNGIMKISSSTMFIADTTGSTGTLNLGSPAGSAPTAPGMLEAKTVAFGAGTGALVFNHTSTNYVFAPAVTGTGAIDVLAGNTVMTGSLGQFTGTVHVDGGSVLLADSADGFGGAIDVAPGAAITTLAQQQASVQDLANREQASMIDSRATANQLLGMNRPLTDDSYAWAGALFGSAEGLVGGQYAHRGVTLLGGFSYGAQDYPGIAQADAPSVAAAVRYTFDDPFDDEGNAHPFTELGGWVTPNEGLTPSRSYTTLSGSYAGQGDANAIAWDDYARLGMLWNADGNDQFTGYGEFGQQSLSFGGYAESSGPSNPFPATVQSGVARYDVMRFGGSWTRDLVYMPWSVTLSGGAAHAFDPHSGLTATVDGIGIAAPNMTTTWGEFGAQFNADLTDRITASLGFTGTTGAGQLGTSVHGTVGVGYSF